MGWNNDLSGLELRKTSGIFHGAPISLPINPQINVDDMIKPPTAATTTTDSRHPAARAGTLVRVRDTTPEDLDSINALVAAAMKSWQLSERVLRLSLPLYRYSTQDFEHQRILLAETGNALPVGMAAIEAAGTSNNPAARNPALLHGIYVDPGYHRLGIGSELLARVEGSARSMGFDGLLVKANPAATAFFEARKFQRLPNLDPARDYPHRYWQPF